MGCNASKSFKVNDLFQGQDEASLEILTDVGFTIEDVNQYYGGFCAIDDSHSGLITAKEMISYFNIPHSPLTIGILKLFDADANGSIDFLEFCCAIWNFLSISDAEITQMVFY